MSAWVGAAWLVAGFLIFMRVFSMVARSRDVIQLTRESVALMRDPEATDDQKEKMLQRNAVRVWGLFFLLTIGVAAAVFVPLGILWLSDRAGWLPYEASLKAALSMPFIVVSCAVITLGILAIRWAKPDDTGYSALDRAVHRVAFHTYGVQTAVADAEDRVYARRLESVSMRPPIFVTGLPRAGTTLLLDCLSAVPGLASHSYRDMPFVPVPLFWNAVSGRFRRDAALKERAHGDGMSVGYDSAEAFEEILWHAFWREQYKGDRIAPWSEKADAEFTRFLERHMRKIVLLRGDDAGGRYVSKNNLNIARIPLLKTMFDGAVIIVPFRDPLQHALSLVEQHRNFLSLHATDRFAAEYMKAIGHYDFGRNLKPVNFGGWLDGRDGPGAESLAFWVEYWCAAYGDLLTHREHVHLLDYDQFCREPSHVLSRIGDWLELSEGDPLHTAAANIRAPRAHDVGTEVLPVDTLARANKLHAALREAAGE